MPFRLTSDAFEEGAGIPIRHTCDGENLSPGLRWSGAPPGTRALALIMFDPDAPIKDFCHWSLWNWPADQEELPEAIPGSGRLPNGAAQGETGFHRTGYGGPCPPRGPAHRYRFVLYALEAPPALGPEAGRDAVLEAMAGHVLGQTQLEGRYQRAG